MEIAYNHINVSYDVLFNELAGNCTKKPTIRDDTACKRETYCQRNAETCKPLTGVKLSRAAVYWLLQFTRWTDYPAWQKARDCLQVEQDIRFSWRVARVGTRGQGAVRITTEGRNVTSRVRRAGRSQSRSLGRLTLSQFRALKTNLCL